MRALVYYVGTSLDGYIAGPAGEYDFYPLADDLAAALGDRYPETMPTHLRAAAGVDGVPNRRFDTVVMGRGTYQPALDVGIASPYAHLRQYVVTSTLPSVAEPAVTLVPSDPVGLVRHLKAENGADGGEGAAGAGDIWLCGGGVLAGQLLPLIDELIFKAYPVVAGAGRPVIAGAFRPSGFRPVEAEQFSNGTVVTRYVRG